MRTMVRDCKTMVSSTNVEKPSFFFASWLSRQPASTLPH
jgi:hypothetical protein